MGFLTNFWQGSYHPMVHHITKEKKRENNRENTKDVCIHPEKFIWNASFLIAYRGQIFSLCNVTHLEHATFGHTKILFIFRFFFLFCTKPLFQPHDTEWVTVVERTHTLTHTYTHTQKTKTPTHTLKCSLLALIVNEGASWRYIFLSS